MNRNCLTAALSLLLTLFTCQGAFGLSVLMLTDSSGSLTTVESTLKSRLESAGYTVNTLWDGDTQSNYTAAFANNDVVYIPSDVSATDIGTKLRTCTIGVVNELVGFMDDLGLCTSAGSTTSVSSITIATNSHYVTSPYSTGFFTLGSSSYAVSRTGGTTASGAVVLATVGGVNSIVAVDTGATLANTINSNNTAAGRRIQMPIQCGVVDTSTMTSNAQNLLLRIVQWAALLDGKLEAQWKLNETSGASASDSSGNSRTGTVTGAASWVSAVLNNGFSFNGATKIQATGLMGSPRNVSVTAWANLTAADTSGAEVISLGDHFALRLDDSGATKAIFYNGSSYTTASVNVTYAGTGWHHFAAVFDDGHNTLKLYIDGTLAATTTTTSSISWSGLGSNTVIGRHGNSGTSSDFTGTLDEVRVYSYAISATEVAQLYGLIGRWTLNETSGTTANDSTVFGRAGALSGTAHWSTDCGGMGVFDFDGASNYFTVANATDFQPTGMISMSAWVKGNVWKDSSGGDVDAIVRKGDSTPNNYSLAIASGKVMFLLDDSDTVGIRGNTVLNAGQWYHVAATWDGVTARIYVNGVLDNSPGTAKAAPIGTDTRPVYIGGRPGSDYFDGQIRDVRIYNRPLTATELVQGAGLMGWWKFSEGSGTSAADSSGMGNTVTLNASAAWTSDCTGNNNALLTNGTASGTAVTTAPFNPPDVGTVALWMRSTGAPGATARIIGLGGDWEVRQQADGTVVTDLCGDGATTICTVTPLTEVGRWYHLAFTFDSSNDTYAIYVDGQLERSGTNPVNMVQQAAAVLSFGTRTGATEYWSGALRDVRVYSRKLCPTEIASLYGLAGWWKLDDGSGSTATDSSGLSNHGTVLNSPTWTTGKVSGALQLNGTTQYVSVPNSSSLSIKNQLTVSGWAKANNLTGWHMILNKGTSTSTSNYFLGFNGNRLSFGFYTGGWREFTDTSTTLSSNTWYHLAATFNDANDQVILYVNGNAVYTTTTTSTPTFNTQNLLLGNSEANEYWSGTLDDIRIYNRALCPTEIQQIKNLGGTFGGVKVTKWVEIQ